MKHGLGALESPPDVRDYTLAMLDIPKAGTIEDIIVKYKPVDIYNQERTSQCVAFAFRSIVECMERKERDKHEAFSNSFIYGNRPPEMYQGEGMYPRDALSMLKKYGTVGYSDMDILSNYPTCNTFVKENYKTLYPNSVGQRIKGYIKLEDDLDAYSFMEKEQVPIGISIRVYQSFYDTPDTGIVTAPSGTLHGGHFMAQVGFITLNNEKYRVVYNSWGKAEGKDGIFFMPLSYPVTEMWGVYNQTATEMVAQANQIIFLVDSDTYFVDGVLKKNDVAPFIKDSRLFGPYRAIGEACGYIVDYLKPPSPDQKAIVVLYRGGRVIE